MLNTFPTPMATITKRELVIKITDNLNAKAIGITQQDVLEVVQTLIDEITNALSHGDTVVMRNFGAFQVREMKAKIGRNPKDPAKDVPIPARAAVKFKPGKEMKEKVSNTLQVIRERKS
jgi:DNA-binding protein HU-beta/integration host factor subunit alpha